MLVTQDASHHAAARRTWALPEFLINSPLSALAVTLLVPLVVLFF